MIGSLRILGYHKIGPPSRDAWETWYYVPTATFIRQMTQLRDGGWKVISEHTLLRALASPETLPERAVMITFDDGYTSVLHHAAPVLRRFNFPAMVFVPTHYIAGGSTFDANTREPVEPICSWQELHELEIAGICVESHGASHKTFSDLNATQIEAELRDSKIDLERGLNKTVGFHAYPYDDPGRHPDQTDTALKNLGYQAAFHFTGGACAWPPANPYHLTRIPVWPDTDLSKELA